MTSVRRRHRWQKNVVEPWRNVNYLTKIYSLRIFMIRNIISWNHSKAVNPWFVRNHNPLLLKISKNPTMTCFAWEICQILPADWRKIGGPNWPESLRVFLSLRSLKMATSAKETWKIWSWSCTHPNRKYVEMTTSQSCDSTSCLNKSRSFTTVVVEKMSKQPLDTRIRRKKMKNQVAPRVDTTRNASKRSTTCVSLLSNLEIFQLENIWVSHFFTNCKAITSR